MRKVYQQTITFVITHADINVLDRLVDNLNNTVLHSDANVVTRQGRLQMLLEVETKNGDTLTFTMRSNSVLIADANTQEIIDIQTTVRGDE